jgi:hypothetical protein
MAMYMLEALREGRILAYHPQRSVYLHLIGDYCGKKPYADCIFEPITNCTITKKSNVNYKSNKDMNDAYPSWLGKFLHNSMIAHEPYAMAWFWKAQVVSFQCRLNNRSRTWIEDQMTRSGIPLEMFRPGGFDVSIHIRHTDAEWRKISNEEYASVLSMVRRIFDRDLNVFLASDDPHALSFFKNLSGIRVYHLQGAARDEWQNDTGRMKSGGLARLFALADFMLMAQANVVIGTFLSNVIRFVMELRGAQLGMASNLLLEVGQVDCVSMTHCEYLGIDWQFDFRIRTNGTRNSWSPFTPLWFGEKYSGAKRSELFRQHLTDPNLLPQEI